MKTALINIIVFLIFAKNAVAYERVQFELSIPPAYDTEKYKEDLKGWTKSLITGVGYSPGTITEVIFLKTNIPIVVNDKKMSGAVYQNRDNPNQFYISKPKIAVVDFKAKLVGTMGVAGISSHPTPSQRMIVVLAPEKNTNILGVTLDSTAKTQVRKPVFKDAQVSYEW